MQSKKSKAPRQDSATLLGMLADAAASLAPIQVAKQAEDPAACIVRTFNEKRKQVERAKLELSPAGTFFSTASSSSRSPPTSTKHSMDGCVDSVIGDSDEEYARLLEIGEEKYQSTRRLYEKSSGKRVRRMSSSVTSSAHIAAGDADVSSVSYTVKSEDDVTGSEAEGQDSMEKPNLANQIAAPIMIKIPVPRTGNLPPNIVEYEISFMCPFPGCAARFQRPCNFRSHYRKHQPRLFQCTKCLSRFKRSNDLRRHIRSHENIRPYPCKICGSRYSRADILSKCLWLLSPSIGNA